MSEVKAGRRASFSMLFMAELVAQAAIGCAAVRFGEVDWEFLRAIPTASGIVQNIISPFLCAFWLLQGASVLVERARGMGCPWGFGRWAAAYLVFATPLHVILFARHNGVDWQLVEMMASEHLWTNWAKDYLAFCVSYQTIPLIAILLSLKLGRGSEERAKGVVDAREWVCRGLAVVLVASFVGMAVLDFVGY